MLLFRNFYSYNPEKENDASHLHKTLCSRTVFNIDNKKHSFLSTKTGHYNDFRRTMKTRVMAALYNIIVILN